MTRLTVARVLCAVVVAGAALVVATPASSAPSSSGLARSTPAKGKAGSGIDGLRHAPEHSRTGYDRDLFQHWIDADRDGCDTRDEVFIAESLTPAIITSGCTVTGAWYSSYDGVTTADPSTFDIDHTVALGEAWDSGADTWDAARRRDYANDLDFDGALIAVSAASNRSKSDQDPAEWLPPRPEARCPFAGAWVHTKLRWDLSADDTEIAALRQALAGCR